MPVSKYPKNDKYQKNNAESCYFLVTTKRSSFYSFTYKNNFLSKMKLLTFIKFVSLFKINVEEAKNVHII